MKTFRLTSFFILKEDSDHSEFIEVPLVDGLIINREDSSGKWLLEALVTEDTSAEVKPLLENTDVKIEVTITKRTNPPAAFLAKLKSINKFEHHISILLDAVIIRDKEDVSDIILKNLIAEGYGGEQLLDRFTEIKRERGAEYREKLAKDLKKNNGSK